MSCSMSSVSDIKLIRQILHLILAKRPRSDAQNGPRQPECCTAPAQKIWWCYCRPDCLAQNASLQVQQHNSKPSLSDGSGHCSLCCPTATNQPTRQVTLSFNSPYKRANFRDDFLVYDHTTGKHRFSSDHRS